MSQPKGTPTTPGILGCATCAKSIGRKLTITCSACSKTYHTSCVPDFSGSGLNPNDIEKCLKIAGLMWYCKTCLPTLKDYVLAPDLINNISSISLKLNHVSDLMCKSLDIVESNHASLIDIDRCSKQIKEDQAPLRNTSDKLEYLTRVIEKSVEQSQSNADSVKGNVEHLTRVFEKSVDQCQSYADSVKGTAGDKVDTEVKSIVKRLETQLSKDLEQKAKCERSLNAIVHGVEETGNTADAIWDICGYVDFDSHCITNISRLGRRNMNPDSTSGKRPVKLVFTTELYKSEFMHKYNRWSNKGTSFVTLDLSVEDREKEYKLRVKRRELVNKYPHGPTGRIFQIRNGALIMKTRDSDWVKLDDSDCVGLLSDTSTVDSQK